MEMALLEECWLLISGGGDGVRGGRLDSLEVETGTSLELDASAECKNEFRSESKISYLDLLSWQLFSPILSLHI
jgi:hypothetical protein